jgi:hypothetical protein
MYLCYEQWSGHNLSLMRTLDMGCSLVWHRPWFCTVALHGFGREKKSCSTGPAVGAHL